MKKGIVLLTAIVAIAVMFLGKASDKVVESKLFLENVEALAADEFGHYICIGSGNIVCNTGEKVEYLLTPFSLD
ncbi:NVEALA domain-containing protein [Phocaeicola sp.]